MSAPKFRALHHGPDLLVLPNVWDVVSARVFADAGFPALATASAAVCAVLGYADGQRIPPDEMFAAVGRIARGVDVPVTADIEAGYGLPPEELVARLLHAGAVGCNLEDSDPATGALADIELQADRLAAIRAAAGDALVVNARIDVFLAGRTSGPGGPGGPGGEVVEAISRGRRYREAGADCVYPILAPADLLPELAGGIGGPINALHRPGGPSPAELGDRGATRVTFGPGLLDRATEALRTLAATLAC